MKVLIRKVKEEVKKVFTSEKLIGYRAVGNWDTFCVATQQKAGVQFVVIVEKLVTFAIRCA